jgi:hypothetical protein
MTKAMKLMPGDHNDPAQLVADLTKKLNRLTDEIRQLSAIHHINDYLNYSGIVIKKVNGSFATNAFTTIQNEMLRSQILGVCRIWDRYDPNGFSVLSILKIANEKQFQDAFELHVGNSKFYYLTAKSHAERWADLSEIQKQVEEIKDGKTYLGLVNYRDKFLAHCLELTRREANDKISADVAVKYGDESQLFSKAREIVTTIFSLLIDGQINFSAYDDMYKSEAKLFAESIQFLTKKQFNAREMSK